MTELDLYKIEILRRVSHLSHSEILRFKEIMNSNEFSIKRLAKHFDITIAMTQWLIEELDEYE